MERIKDNDKESKTLIIKKWKREREKAMSID